MNSLPRFEGVTCDVKYWIPLFPEVNVKYQKFLNFLAVDLCEFSLMDAAELLPVSRIYTLYVSEGGFAGTRKLLQEMGAVNKCNPFAPYVNLVICETFRRDEWCLAVDGQAIGSEGV